MKRRITVTEDEMLNSEIIDPSIRSGPMRNKIVNKKLSDAGYWRSSTASELKRYFDCNIRCYIYEWEE